MKNNGCSIHCNNVENKKSQKHSILYRIIHYSKHECSLYMFKVIYFKENTVSGFS